RIWPRSRPLPRRALPPGSAMRKRGCSPSTGDCDCEGERDCDCEGDCNLGGPNLAAGEGAGVHGEALDDRREALVVAYAIAPEAASHLGGDARDLGGAAGAADELHVVRSDAGPGKRVVEAAQDRRCRALRRRLELGTSEPLADVDRRVIETHHRVVYG